MKMEVYSVKDKITGDFASPWLSKNDGAAIRAFRQGGGKVSSPDDFELYFLGFFETESGKFSMDSKPVFITDYSVINEEGRK